MRFLSLFFRLVAFLIITGLVGGLLVRETLLFVAAHNVARQAQRLTQSTRWNEHLRECQSGAAVTSELPFRGVQVRFLDDTTYVVEIDCLGRAPFEVERFGLPPGVRKTTGSAGFYYDLANRTLSGELTLRLWRQQRLVYATDLQVAQQWGSTVVRSDVPISQCAAHGLKCCSPVEYQGVGDPMIGGVLDCPGSCFGSCLSRPILLSFQTDPPADAVSRIVELSGQENLVFFGYTFDSSEASIDTVTIDYGDGTQETSAGMTGRFEKEYQCLSRQPCQFTVTLSATDSRGILAAPTRLSTLTVVLNPGL